MQYSRINRYVTALVVGLSCAGLSHAGGWSANEVRFKYGDRLNPVSGEEARTTLTTFQHASGWAYGENFYFIDYITDDNSDGFNDNVFYGEWYPFFGTRELFSIDYPDYIRDAGVVLGVNASGESQVRKYLPGVQVNWELPGFAFFNTMVTAYIDDSAGLANGGAPKEEDSFMIDVAWKYPFTLGDQRFSFEGHVEYIDGRDNADVDGRAKSWVLAQPQLRWDLGHAVTGQSDRLHVGIEYEYWRNKLGFDDTDSNAQAILAWMF